MITELEATSPASLRAVFSFGQPRQVRIELDIGLIGDGSEAHWAEIARIIDGTRYHQRLDPACTECDWHQILNLVRRCHEAARLASGHLITSIRIEDRKGGSREIDSNFESAKNHSSRPAIHSLQPGSATAGTKIEHPPVPHSP